VSIVGSAAVLTEASASICCGSCNNEASARLVAGLVLMKATSAVLSDVLLYLSLCWWTFGTSLSLPNRRSWTPKSLTVRPLRSLAGVESLAVDLDGECQSFISAVIGDKVPRGFNYYQTNLAFVTSSIRFDPSKYVGRSLQEFGIEIEKMFSAIDEEKPTYYGSLKGRGAGKSTICEMLRSACVTENDVLPVCVNFGAPSALSLDLPYWQCIRGAANEVCFGLAVVARILYDKFSFSTFSAVVGAMMSASKTHSKIFSLQALESDASTLLGSRLIDQALCAVHDRILLDGIKYSRILVVVDESDAAASLWKLPNRALFGSLTGPTVHKTHWLRKFVHPPWPRNLSCTLFMTSIGIRPFEKVPETTSVVRIMDIPSLDPQSIADRWLGLQFGAAANRDAVLRLLSVLSPLPRIIAQLFPSIQRLSNKEGDVKYQDIAEVYNEAQRVYQELYARNQYSLVKNISFGLLYSLVFGKGVMLSTNILALVAESFLISQVQVVDPDDLERNPDVVPLSPAFVLAQEYGPPKDSRAATLLACLQQQCSKSIDSLLKTTGPKAANAGTTLEEIFANWLSVRVAAALLAKKVEHCKFKYRVSRLCLIVRRKQAFWSYLALTKNLTGNRVIL
jgi:hypothetical protein